MKRYQYAIYEQKNVQQHVSKPYLHAEDCRLDQGHEQM
jgi:hypothetical protein